MKRTFPVLMTAILLVAAIALSQTPTPAPTPTPTPTPAPAPAPAPAPKPMPAQPATGIGMSGNMQATMSQIATDKTLRMQMVQELINVARTDTTFRHEMLRAIMADKDMHATMQQMHQGAPPAGKGSMHTGAARRDTVRVKPDTLQTPKTK